MKTKKITNSENIVKIQNKFFMILNTQRALTLQQKGISQTNENIDCSQRGKSK